MESAGNIIQRNKFWTTLFSIFLGVSWAQADLTKKIQLLFYFDKIEVNGAINVFVQPGDRNEEATIFADSSIMENISLTVRDRTLYLDANNTYDLARRLPFIKLSAERIFPVEILVNTDKLSEIRLNERSNLTVSDIRSPRLSVFTTGTGRLHLDNSSIDNLSVRQDGNGPIILKGKEVSSLELIVIGDGLIFAQDLPVDRARVLHRGNANVEINPLSFLDSRIFGQGNILLHSKPENIVVSQKGTGKVIDVIPDSPPLYDMNATRPVLFGKERPKRN